MLKKYIVQYFPLIVIAFACLSIVLSSYVAGPPAASTNAPGENSCFASPACHGGAPNTGPGFSEITVMGGIPTGNFYTPGTTYSMMPYVVDTTMVKSGMQIVARLANGNNAGTPSITMPTTTQIISAGGYDYVEQTTAGALQPIFSNMHNRMYDWQAPTAGSGTVVFYLAAVAANGNNSPSGDYIYTDTLVLYEDTASSVKELDQIQNFTVNKMYPLPSKNFINFDVTTNKAISLFVSIIDLKGSVVKDIVFDINDISTNTINVATLKSGIYFVKFEQKGKPALYRKIVKLDR